MNDIIPAILAHSETDLRERLAIAETFAPVVQIDVADGHFVPDATWFDPNVIGKIKTKTKFELHLMVSDPTAYIGMAQSLKNITRIIWHIEVAIGHDVLINWCKKLKIGSGLAISPETPVGRLAPFAETANEILVLGVNPGRSGQAFIERTVDTAREIHDRWPKTIIGFDGGVSAKTIPRLRDAGVTRFCAASAIFDAKDPQTAFEKLRSA